MVENNITPRNDSDKSLADSKDSAPAATQDKTGTMRFFKKIREKLGLTKYEMANHLGMLPPTYYYYEDKAKGCSFEVLASVRKKLGISWNDLGALIDAEYQSASDMEQILTLRRKSKK